jgi:hypothetical protein
MSTADLPPCVGLYQSDRRAFLTGMIDSLEEELRAIPRHKYNLEKIAYRERMLAEYRETLRRLDAAVAEAPVDPSTP